MGVADKWMESSKLGVLITDVVYLLGLSTFQAMPVPAGLANLD
jgi:hypothetical protein